MIEAGPSPPSVMYANAPFGVTLTPSGSRFAASVTVETVAKLSRPKARCRATPGGVQCFAFRWQLDYFCTDRATRKSLAFSARDDFIAAR